MNLLELTAILHDLNSMLDTQTGLIEALIDRVSSLEECARVTPSEERRRVDEGNKKLEAASDNPFV